MSELPLHSTSSSLYIPDDMIEDEDQNQVHEDDLLPTPSLTHSSTASLQPKSLRSLANFTKSQSPPIPTHTLTHSPTHTIPDGGDQELPVPVPVPVPVEVEPELQHNATTFVALESDLGLLFGSTTLCPQQQQEPLGPSHTSHTSHTPHLSQTSHLSQISKSYSRSEYEEEIAELKNREVDYIREIADLKNKEQIWQKEMTELRSTIEQLELDNIDLSEGLARVTEQNKQLKEDSDLQTQDARSSMQELKMSLKEKQEELQRTENGRSMLLSKVGSHDSLKDQNASLSRELADKNNEVTRLQNQLNSNSGLVSQLQQDLERVNAELVTSQMEVERRRNEFENKRKDCEGLKDAMSLQKIDMDREFSRQENKIRDMEAEIRRLEDLSRVLQVDGNDRTHSEARLKSELGAADSRVQQLEADNSTLRRRVLDLTEEKGRELSQALTNNASFESANRVLTDEVNQLRRSVAQLQSASAVTQSQPLNYQSSAPPPMQHHQTHHYQSHQPSSLPTHQQPVAQYHAPPPRQPVSSSNGDYRDMYSTAERAKKDAEFPARHASSLDYNSQRERDVPKNNAPPIPPTSARAHNFPDNRTKEDAQFPAHLSSSLDYNSRRESEMRRSSADNPPPSRYQYQEEQPNRRQSPGSGNGSRSLRGYADNVTSQQSGATSSAPTSGGSSSGSVRSLASLVSGGGSAQHTTGKRGTPLSSSSPFATSVTASHIQTFDELETQLTGFMTEKTTLSQELERLHQRGGKTLKDRTRFVQVEARLDELSKSIGRTRRELAQKPH